MSPEKQRIAIAEACGWVGCIRETGYTKYESWSKCCPHFVPSEERKGWWFASIPDFFGDLNAMHEAVNTLTNEGISRYLSILQDVSGCVDGDILPVILQRANGSTAAQRAEAFLKTIGKWTDDE